MFAVAMTSVNMLPIIMHQSDAIASATVTVGNVSPTMFCAGSNLSVPYTANSGFTTGNVFTAQLSNATGSFGSPVNIGSVTSTTSGTISTTIPLGTGAGTGYLIRIVSTSPSVTSINTSNTLIIYAVPSATISSQINVTCHGFNNGSAVVAPGGGISPYSYLWMPGVETSAGILGLAPNNYVVTLTDSNGCTATTSATITQPAVLNATIPSGNITNVSCHGLTNGSAFVTVSGGTTPYSYFWYPSSQTVDTATGLAPGSYNVTVTDANGCTATATSPSITQPSAALSVNIPPPNITNIPCYNGSTGSILANVSGGTPGYSYSWFPSAETTNPAINLMAGTYFVTVTDANGCTAVGGSATLHDLDTTALTATLRDTTIYSIEILAIYPSGGSTPYTYLWSPSGATTQTIVSTMFGSNSVTVTDSNGCSYTISQTLTLPDTEAISGVTAFFPNHGQIVHTDTTSASEVKFYTLHNYPANFFLQDTISYVFSKLDTSSSHYDTLQRIDLSFVKGNTSNPIAINQYTSGALNYYLPQCPSGITDVYGYQYLLYPEVYNHVEALFAGNADGLKYYIIAMPGADTSAIELQYSGADSIVVLVDGEQEIYSPLGYLKLAPPEVYQMDSSGARVNLTWNANYYSPSAGQIRFHLGAFNPHFPLIMQMDEKHITSLYDTVCQANWCWSSYFGGTGDDVGQCITNDNSGHAYMGGNTTSTINSQFPLYHQIQTGNNGNYDCFIAKYNNSSSNTAFPWNLNYCTFWGGDGGDFANSISVLNSTQDVYFVGQTNSTTGMTPYGSNNYVNGPGGDYDGFILKLDSNGVRTWFSYIGGSAYDITTGVAVSQNAGNPYVYVVGITKSEGGTATGDFIIDTSSNANAYNQIQNNQTSSSGNGFVMKFKYTGNDSLIWSSLFGGDNFTEFYNITLQNSNIVIGGETNSDNPDTPSVPVSTTPVTASNANSSSHSLQLCFPNHTSPYPFYRPSIPTSSYADLIFVAFTYSDQLIWSTYFGGDESEQTNYNCLITNGKTLYCMGSSGSSSGSFPIYPSTAPSYFWQNTNQSGHDYFIVKFGENFDQEWTTFLGWTGSGMNENGYFAITSDANYNVYVTGSTTGTVTASSCSANSNFPMCNSNSWYQSVHGSGQWDGFIFGFDESNNLFWSTLLGSNNSLLTGLSVDLNNNLLYITGLGFIGSNSIFQIEEFTPLNTLTALYWQNGLQVAGNDAEVGRFNLNNPTTGINNHKSDNTKGMLFVYPNPTSDILNILLDLQNQDCYKQVSIKIVDVMGRVVIDKKENTSSILQTVLNINDLQNGTYILQIVTESKVYNKTFILNK